MAFSNFPCYPRLEGFEWFRPCWPSNQLWTISTPTLLQTPEDWRWFQCFSTNPTWAVSKRSCSSEGDKDMLTGPLAPCLRHHSFGLREGFCWICTYAELTLTGFCTPPQRQLTRSNFYKQNAMVLESPSGIRCGRSRRRWGSPEGGSHQP